MKQPMAPTLSAHLLEEARKFSVYPNTIRRTKANLKFQRSFDKGMETIALWRKTFAPRNDRTLEDLFFHDKPLEEFYCRDLLKNVPSIVERTLKLKYLVLSGIPPSQFVYLVEAANCYIYGLSQAAVALARAAMEESLRDKLALSVGKKAAKALDLEDIIKDLGRTKDLSRDRVTRAHNVRISGNKVLHPEP
jgi:hypothetical protein